jgi:S1-C subfamily serine protease
VGGKAVASSSDLTTALASHDPGDRVSIAWTDASGTAHTATVPSDQAPQTQGPRGQTSGWDTARIAR